DEHGVLVARTDYPTESDIDLSRGALIAGALSGDETSGAWVDERRRKLFMAVAVPLRASPQAAPQGSLIAAYAIDDTLAHQIRQATTTDVVFFALDTLNRPYIVGSTLPREAVEPALVADTGAMAALTRDTAGTELVADVDGERLIGLALATRRVQDGDYSVEIGVPSGDEIGMLSQAFQSLVADLKEKAKLVEYMMATSGAAPTEQLKSTRPSIGAATGSGLRPGSLF